MTSRFLTLALAVTAALGLPAGAFAQSRSPTFWAGAGAGLEFGTVSGWQLKAEGEIPLQRLTPQLRVEAVGTLGGGSLSSNSYWKVLAAPRAIVTITPILEGYVDVGAGVYHTWWTGNHSTTGFTFRFGGGATYAFSSTAKGFVDVGYGHYNRGVGPHSEASTLALVAGAKIGF